MLIKFTKQHEQYKVGTIADVGIDRARRLIELGFASVIPTLQSLPDVKSYDDYEDKHLHEEGEDKIIVEKKKPATVPRGKPRAQTKN